MFGEMHMRAKARTPTGCCSDATSAARNVHSEHENSSDRCPHTSSGIKRAKGRRETPYASRKNAGVSRVVDGSQPTHGCGTAIAYAFPQRKDGHAEGDENERAGIPNQAGRADG